MDQERHLLQSLNQKNSGNLTRSGSVSWATAIFFKSIKKLECKALVLIQESASATELLDLLVYLISLVNCAT